MRLISDRWSVTINRSKAQTDMKAIPFGVAARRPVLFPAADGKAPETSTAG